MHIPHDKYLRMLTLTVVVALIGIYAGSVIAQYVATPQPINTDTLGISLNAGANIACREANLPQASMILLDDTQAWMFGPGRFSVYCGGTKRTVSFKPNFHVQAIVQAGSLGSYIKSWCKNDDHHDKNADVYYEYGQDQDNGVVKATCWRGGAYAPRDVI